MTKFQASCGLMVVSKDTSKSKAVRLSRANRRAVDATAGGLARSVEYVQRDAGF